MNVLWVRSPNFTPGRNGRKPDVIVIHVTEGTLAGTDSWFRTRKSGVSAHYGIGLKREVHQYVTEEDAAWHAGRVNKPTARIIKERKGVNPNLFSIGIEHEGMATTVWPDTMYEDSATLVRDIAQRWSIPLDRDHVIGHREIFSLKSCPGAGDVDRIVRQAAGLGIATVPQRVWSNHFNEHLIVTRYVSDTDWYFVRESEIGLEHKATTALSHMPPARDG